LNITAIIEVFNAVREYIFPYEKIRNKINPVNNIEDLKKFIKERSSLVTQTTLYGYLKTRMGLKYTLMFSDDIFLDSVNKAKWRIFSEAASDLTLYTCSYLFNQKSFDKKKINDIFNSVMDNEKKNNIPLNILKESKDKFEKRIVLINIQNFCKINPFENSCEALYNWSPIADELKVLDKEIVLNSMKNKWSLVVKDFINLSKNFE
tara:strand:+ start:426 stop:1043 length:618 start_codon:yes stop_codon:yes gene_type:complete